MTLAYFDCFSGISGDMTLGALVSLGLPLQWLREQIGRLPLDGFDLVAHNVTRNGIQAVQVVVETGESHHHRNYGTIRTVIQASPYSEKVKGMAMGIFDRIAAAEARIHGIDKETVHFHEVGAVDALVDVVGTCLGLEYLGIGQVVASPLPLGSGFVRCQHGVLPVPAPATLEILKNIPVYGGDVSKELVTPTGAAIVAAIAGSFEALPAMQVGRVGYGAGTHDLGDRPNLLRILIGDPVEACGQDCQQRLILIETAIDDMNPEIFGFLMDKLLAEGALDVYWTSIQMKKNRPGTLVTILCDADRKSAVTRRLFEETTTLGVRFHEVRRATLARRASRIDTPFGQVDVKEVVTPDGSRRIVPEFEACRRVAEKHGLPLQQVYAIIHRRAQSPDPEQK